MPTSRATTVRDLRKSNQARTLWELYLHGPLTYHEVAASVGVSLATVSNVMGDLIRLGAVTEVGMEDSNGGRPRGLFHVNPEYGYVVGVDVGETAVLVELFDLGMKLRASHRSLTQHTRLDPQEVVDQVVDGLNAVVDESGVARTSILGVGVGVPGLVERGVETVVYDQGAGWGVVPFERMLRARIHLPLVVDNGANTLGQAERWFGAARESVNAIIVLLGAGVGASIVAMPVEYDEARAFAGEFGHTSVLAGGRVCPCGAKGHLEAYAGADAIVARYDHLKRHRHAANPSEVEERMIAILKAEDSDHIAAQVIEELVLYLGVGIANLVNLFTPDRIVIGGWVGNALNDRMLPRIRDAVEANALTRPFGRLEIVRAELGTDAVALGAATLPVAEFLRSGGAPTVAPRVRRGLAS